MITSYVKSVYRQITPPHVRLTVRIARQPFSHPPCLIYQMGKVGSRTMYRSIVESPLNVKVFHIHSLQASRLRKQRRKYRSEGRLNSDNARHSHVARGLYWRILWDPALSFDVVTGVREPIRRAISQIVQGGSVRYPQTGRNGEIDAERLLAFLENTIRPDSAIVRRAYTWLEKELAATLGIDPYNISFAPRQGYALFSHHRGSGMIYRLESIVDAIENGLPELLNVDQAFEVMERNTTSAKRDASAYQHALATFRLNRQVVEAIYDHPYMPHFYSSEEIEAFTEHWSV